MALWIYWKEHSENQQIGVLCMALSVDKVNFFFLKVQTFDVQSRVLRVLSKQNRKHSGMTFLNVSNIDNDDFLISTRVWTKKKYKKKSKYLNK